MTWNDTFLTLFDKCLALYEGGNKSFDNACNAEEFAFLHSIGYSPREFYDFVEDFADTGAPSKSSALLVASVRRDYLLVMQDGEHSTNKITRDDLPTFGDELGGMGYLPRILVKAKAKLKGELDPDLMYSCGGDLNFLSKHGDIHPADFLRQVWASNEDDQRVVDYIKSQMDGALS